MEHSKTSQYRQNGKVAGGPIKILGDENIHISKDHNVWANISRFYNANGHVTMDINICASIDDKRHTLFNYVVKGNYTRHLSKINSALSASF